MTLHKRYALHTEAANFQPGLSSNEETIRAV